MLTAVFSLPAVPVFAAPPPLTLDAKSAIVLDYTTGQVLFEQNPDAPIPPASLTKLMTLHLAYKKLSDGSMKREDKVQVGRDAWAAQMPGSSVMELEPGQNVTVGEIMKGIAIPSGNDAAVALADHMAGTVDAFVALMNKEARDMGYKTMHFYDPAGLDPRNLITAREYADFARKYVQMHPDALQELHSVKEFTYPLPQNLPAGKTPKDSPAVTQHNRNTLLWEMEGVVDGLKTGFIDESGYNIAVTAHQGDMRVVGVILGVPGRDEVQGSRKRADAAKAMITWGFQNFALAKPPVPATKPVRVWKGAANEVALQPEHPVVFTVEKGQENKLTATLTQQESIMAPVKKGDVLGELVYAADGKQIISYKLVAADDVRQGNIFKRLWDTIRLTVSGWFHKKK
jgi:D-alanyl-D-alanine carboxypeptidase (penicillin-binding protein 5/6)